MQAAVTEFGQGALASVKKRLLPKLRQYARQGDDFACLVLFANALVERHGALWYWNGLRDAPEELRVVRDFLLMVRLQEPKPCVTEFERQAMLASWKAGFAFSDELRSLLAGEREPDARYGPGTAPVASTSSPRWRTRPYLMLSLLLLVVATVAVVLSCHRRRLLAGGLMCAPFGILSEVFVPAYWNPAVTSLGIANLEPFLFLMGAGIAATCFAVFPVRGKLRILPRSGAQFPFATLGIHTWELLWACAFGCCWPLCVLCVVDAGMKWTQDSFPEKSRKES